MERRGLVREIMSLHISLARFKEIPRKVKKEIPRKVKKEIL